MTKTLDDFKQGGYDQLTFPESGVANVQYLGQEIVETQWGDRVKIAVYDLVELKETAIYTTSAKLLRLLFDELKTQVNDKLAIKRSGTGFQTKYDAKIIQRNQPEKGQPIPAGPESTKQAEPPKPAVVDPF